MIVMQLTLTENSEEELMQVFSRFDKNKDDQIDFEDLFHVFKELNI